MQIEVTWNLFSTPIVVSLSTALLIYRLNRAEKAKEKREMAMANLLEEKEQLKEDAITEWRNSYTNTLCKIKIAVEKTQEGMSQKVDKAECYNEHAGVWERINHLYDERVKTNGAP